MILWYFIGFIGCAAWWYIGEYVMVELWAVDLVSNRWRYYEPKPRRCPTPWGILGFLAFSFAGPAAPASFLLIMIIYWLCHIPYGFWNWMKTPVCKRKH